MLVIGLKPSLSREGFPQSMLIRSFAKLFRQCAGRLRQQRCRALGLEGADYARGHIQAWLSKGIGSDANAIPEKNAQKIFRAVDQILRAGRADAEDEEHKQ